MSLGIKMITDNDMLIQAEKANTEKHLLELEAETARYKRYQTSAATRIQPKRNATVPTTTDSIVFVGLPGTLGSKTQSVG
ncbi:hypothetical protein MAM1_0088c04799 [Mucor ambiguus]|uniref:Uncharacterized protein n=1 Tax=Mucor ambiguus TaxID=91626 RepID=A0A0C9MDE7_9FUNG|nr:hypothetical protein MAM1_0088c04799 [Mucor ambiguus]